LDGLVVIIEDVVVTDLLLQLFDVTLLSLSKGPLFPTKTASQLFDLRNWWDEMWPKWIAHYKAKGCLFHTTRDSGLRRADLLGQPYSERLSC
jgi:hypothetical protein